MKQEPQYEGYFLFKDFKWGNVTNSSFDPASISKIFYMIYIHSELYSSEGVEFELKLTLGQYLKYRYGSVTLSAFDIGRVFTLNELIELSLDSSCNIATGMIADYVGRDKVNDFVKRRLGLLHTSINGPKTPNLTCELDLWKLGRQLVTNKKYARVLEILSGRRKKSIVMDILGDKFEVFSKGGTTFQGLRRDWGIVKQGDEYGYFLIYQVQDPKVRYSIIDRILAKFNKGNLHNSLLYLDMDFTKKIKEITAPLTYVQSNSLN